jgi:hypothetical protein
LPLQPSIEIILDSIIRETEQNSDLTSSIQKLLELDIANPSVRKLLLDYLERTNNYCLIYEHYGTPQNNEEAISLLNAAIELNDSLKMKEVVEIPFIKDNQDTSVKQLVQHIKR